MAMLNDMRIVTSTLLVIDGDPIEKKRTWKERLFSRPWRPLKKTKTIIPKVPDPKAVISNGTIIVHPAVFLDLKQTMSDYGIRPGGGLW